MARLLSKTAQIMIEETAEGTPTLIEGLASWDIDLSCTEVDVTGIYDNNKQYIPGQSDAKGSLTIICDPDSKTLEVIEAAKRSQTPISLVARLNGTGAGKPQLKVPAYITGYTISSSADSRVEVAANWVAAGDIDNTAQVGA